VTPLVLGDNALFEIRPMPVSGITGSPYQIQQAVAARRVMIIVHLKRSERGPEDLNLRFGRYDACLPCVPSQVWVNDSRERAQNDEHEQHFNQGKSIIDAKFNEQVFFGSLHNDDDCCRFCSSS
jgi:hypothetical protein